jgi:hypothetical protein
LNSYLTPFTCRSKTSGRNKWLNGYYKKNTYPIRIL